MTSMFRSPNCRWAHNNSTTQRNANTDTHRNRGLRFLSHTFPTGFLLQRNGNPTGMRRRSMRCDAMRIACECRYGPHPGSAKDVDFGWKSLIGATHDNSGDLLRPENSSWPNGRIMCGIFVGSFGWSVLENGKTEGR